VVLHRVGGQGLYLLDELEAALSTQNQLTLLRRVHELVGQGSQFVIATHSPLVLAYPDALIYELSADAPPEAIDTRPPSRSGSPAGSWPIASGFCRCCWRTRRDRGTGASPRTRGHRRRPGGIADDPGAYEDPSVVRDARVSHFPCLSWSAAGAIAGDRGRHQRGQCQ
jgi:hypothetical protein